MWSNDLGIPKRCVAAAKIFLASTVCWLPFMCGWSQEGVIWGRIAELSLLGGLRCGKFLVQLAIEEMEAANDYDFFVLQATDASRTFYEGLGFVRVGAVAKCVTRRKFALCYLQSQLPCLRRYVAPGTTIESCPVIGYRHWTFSDEPVSHDPKHTQHVVLSLRGVVYNSEIPSTRSLAMHVLT